MDLRVVDVWVVDRWVVAAWVVGAWVAGALGVASECHFVLRVRWVTALTVCMIFKRRVFNLFLLNSIKTVKAVT